MSTADKNLSSYDDSDDLDAKDLEFCIVVSDWNSEITHALLNGCKETLMKQNVKSDDIHIYHVPGAFELPAAARMVDDRYCPNATICLGCVIQGETRHNEYINQAVATGLTQLSIMRSRPFVFGVLTPENQEQALDRAGGRHGNKGVEAAIAAIQMAKLKQSLKDSVSKIGYKA